MSAGATLLETQDGSHTLLSERFGVSYHSKYGAIQESTHVFIQAGLHHVFPARTAIRVLEIGFGTGLNAYLTLLAGIKSTKNIYYETVDPAPISLVQAETLNYPACLQQQPEDFLKIHRSHWNTPHTIVPGFELLKWDKTIQDAPLSGDFNVVYFDAFAPSSQPELWEADVFNKIFVNMAPSGVLVTYCAKGVVKRCLRDVGFKVEGIPGPPGKREMTRAIKL